MDLLTNLLDNSTMPWMTAFILGLMTSISPCPLATNITAIGYIGKNLESRRRVFINGISYSLGRMVSYTLVALLIFRGAGHLEFSGFFQRYGDKLLGPFLILIGLFMLGLVNISFPLFNRFTDRMEKSKRWRFADSFLLGVLFALAFCPYSGVLYFGILIPMSISSSMGLLLPVVFSVATAVPVIIFAWILAYAVHGLGATFNRVRDFEKWFRKITGTLFLGVGVYYVIRIFI